VKVLVSVPVNAVTGYGTDGIELLRALMRWGADVYLHPSGIHPPLPSEVAALLTKPIPEHVDLFISHRCPQELARPESAGVYATSTVALAWTMWEWDSLDNVDRIGEGNCEHAFRVTDNLAGALKGFDAVLAYDKVSQKAMSPYHQQVEVLQGGVTAALPPTPRDWQASPFRFLMVGALSNRKNPFAVIQAFKNLRDRGELRDAQLVLKTTFGGLHPAMEQWCPGLRIIGEVWPEQQIYELYRLSHVLMAPSWGEGKNIPAAQFAMSGGAVAATFVGGHAQWMSDAYAFPLKFEMREIYPGARGAVVDPVHLEETMLRIYTDRGDTARRASTAARVLPSMMSWDKVLERLMLRLGDLAGRRGHEVEAMMRACKRSDSEDPDFAKLRSRGALDGVRV
jgi:hypothetical protein